ncbi:MAG: MoxR family ATPase [Cyanobacteria bacterium P01_E01_bin.6]
MTQEIDYTYTGDYRPPFEDGKEPLRDHKGREYFPYLPEPGLKKALNLAIALQRPLLLEGEPGCGKTRLAASLVYELTCKQLEGNPPDSKTNAEDWWNFYIWNVTSTSRAQDGLYTFDAVGRLRDAQLMGTDPVRLQQYMGKLEAAALKKRMQDKTKYLDFGPLGLALKDQTHRPVVLIDEIDKADSDFPNDLLLQLDELRFDIPELGEGETVQPPEARNKPIILITSNREKPLSEAFLRRCLYYYVPFPGDETLREIIKARFGEKYIDKKAVVDRALDKFNDVYQLLKNQPGSRPPGTSEVLEFVTALLQHQQTDDDTLTELDNLSGELHLLGTLIKTSADQERYIATYPPKEKADNEVSASDG